MIFDFFYVLILEDVINFLDFWFIHFPKKLIRNYFDQIVSFEKILKLRANWRNFFKPLYGDYTIIGHIIALIYRFIIIIFAFILYFLLFIIYAVFLLAWVIFPFFLLIYGLLFS